MHPQHLKEHECSSSVSSPLCLRHHYISEITMWILQAEQQPSQTWGESCLCVSISNRTRAAPNVTINTRYQGQLFFFLAKRSKYGEYGGMDHRRMQCMLSEFLPIPCYELKRRDAGKSKHRGSRRPSASIFRHVFTRCFGSCCPHEQGHSRPPAGNYIAVSQ